MRPRRLYILFFALFALFTLFTLLPFVASAQTFSTVAVPPQSQTYYSYGHMDQPAAPPGSQFLLTFPTQATGGQLTPPACSTYSALQYSHYAWTGTGWTEPVTGPVYGYFTLFNMSAAPVGGWMGLTGNFSFAGTMATNTSPSTQTMVQSIYVSPDQCFEYGPEFGFYRLLQNPGNTTEESTVYFYYGLNVNCYTVGGEGSCRDKQTGASLQYNVTTIPLTIPSANSQGGTNFIYSAHLQTPTEWQITVADPYTGVNVMPPISATVSSFFTTTASAMFADHGLTGYVVETQQRNSIVGGITENMSNPIRTTVFSIAQIVLAASLAPDIYAQPTYSRIAGDCQQGNGTVTTSGIKSSSATLVMRSYPRCTVTVYDVGTTTPATVFADSTGTPKASSFQADVTGHWFFYAPNGRYDVQLSGGGLITPFTLGDMSAFHPSGYTPHNVLAYPEAGVPGVIAVYNGSKQNYVGFTANSLLNTNITWSLPYADTLGCFTSNGLGQMVILPCATTASLSPQGVDTAIQFNDKGSFGGDANFVWDKVNHNLAIVGRGGMAALTVGTGYVISTGGFISAVDSWQGFNTNTDGALLRGLHLASTISNTAGGYINMAPLPYGTQPRPLNGLEAFGAHTGLLWVSALNTSTPDSEQAINTNLYINAAGGFAVCAYNNGSCTPSQFNSIQSPAGGMYAMSFTALNYIQVGTSNGPPTMTTGDSLQKGAMYYDRVTDFMRYWNGISWVDVGSGGGGGGGSPSGPTHAIQTNGGSSSFAGDTYFTYDPATGIVNNANTSGTSGFRATNTNTSTIQAPNGGVTAKWIIASDSMFMLEEAAPALSATGQAKLYADSSTHTIKVSQNGGAFVDIGGGGGGGANTALSNLASVNINSSLLFQTGVDIGSAAKAARDLYLSGAGSYGTNYFKFTGTPTAARTLTLPDRSANVATSSGTLTNGHCVSIDGSGNFIDAGGACTTGGGGGTVASGLNTQLAYYTADGTAVGGSSGMTWDNTGKVLTVITAGSTAGMNVVNGYMQSSAGFTTGSASVAAIQAPSGGVSSKWATVLDSVFWQSVATPPLSAAGQAKIYFNGTHLYASENGGAYVAVIGAGSSGVSSVNGLTGALTLAGTANEVGISSIGGTITLTTPQPLAYASNVLFGSVSTSGAFTSTLTGGVVAFQAGSGVAQILADGRFFGTGYSGTSYAISGVSVINSVRNATFENIQANQGINANLTIQATGNIGTIAGAFTVNGFNVINNSRQFVGAGVNVGSYGITAGGYNIGGAFGQTYTVSIPGMSIGGTGCTGGLTFWGGVLVSCF